MKQEEFVGKWLEMRGQVCDWWAKTIASDRELARRQAGQVQQKYVYHREGEDQKFNQLIEEIKEKSR